MKIREAGAADRDGIVALDPIAARDAARVRLIERALDSATCLVAEREARVIAYGVLEYTFFDHGFVSMLYVAPAERRHGVGRTLMESLAARCETEKLFTSTNRSNEPMQRLLRELGYVESGVIHNLDPGDPELVFFRALGGEAA